jgi:hypothetical protein
MNNTSYPLVSGGVFGLIALNPLGEKGVPLTAAAVLPVSFAELFPMPGILVAMGIGAGTMHEPGKSGRSRPGGDLSGIGRGPYRFSNER